MTYKIKLKDGTVIDNIPNDITFVEAQARIKKGFPNLSEEDFPQNYLIELPNGKVIEFKSSVPIPEAHVILAKQYPSFIDYSERGSSEKAIDNLVVISACYFICILISIVFYKKFIKIKFTTPNLKAVWWSGWLCILTFFISLIGAFSSTQKLIYYPKFWDIDFVLQALAAPAIVFASAYLLSRIYFKIDSLRSVTEDFFALAANEISNGILDEGLWARIYSEKNGDTDKTKAAYIKERASRLKNNT